jgi:hypothetical protein
LKAKEREEDYAFAIYKCMFTITLPEGAQKKRKRLEKAYINEDRISTTSCPRNFFYFKSMLSFFVLCLKDDNLNA